jgi:uncharacterized membrane-anchored protein
MPKVLDRELSVFGTTCGDLVADDLGFGFGPASLVLGAALTSINPPSHPARACALSIGRGPS